MPCPFTVALIVSTCMLLCDDGCVEKAILPGQLIESTHGDGLDEVARQTEVVQLVEALQIGCQHRRDAIAFERQRFERWPRQTGWNPRHQIVVQTELLQTLHSPQRVLFDFGDLVVLEDQQLHLTIALQVAATHHAQIVTYKQINKMLSIKTWPDSSGR